MSKNVKKRSSPKAALEEKKPKKQRMTNPVESASAALPLSPIQNKAAAPPPFRSDNNVTAPQLHAFENVSVGGSPQLLAPPLPPPSIDFSPFPYDFPPIGNNVNAGGGLLPAFGNVNAGGGLLPAFGNVNAGGGLMPAFGNVNAGGAGGGAAISYPSQYSSNEGVAALPPIINSNGGGAGVNDLDYCDSNGSDLKICSDDHKFDDDDDDDDDNVMGDNAYARANYDNFRKKVRCEATGINKFKNFMLKYAKGGNRSPIICFLGWKKHEHEAVGEYPFPVFWLEHKDGDTKLATKAGRCCRSEQLADISLCQVNQSDPQFEARDYLIKYYVHRVDNPPQFDQREALKKYVKEEMDTGDFVALTLNQSDDSVISVEDHEVTNNRNKQYKDVVNGNTYKAFHLKQVVSGGIARLVENLGKYNGFKLRSVGKDRGTVYFIYRKD